MYPDPSSSSAAAKTKAPRTGSVALIGAGPGHPDLLTMKGARLLSLAEVVVYDALLHPAMLDLFPAGAQRVFAGKRAGKHSLSQGAIQEILIAKAREGKRVVRLKGGDPFIFGRGGEEILALQAADVPYEVVPGVSALNGAATGALLPLTHRGRSHSFLAIEGSDADRDGFARALASRVQTVIVFMGGRHAARIAAIALEGGWNGETPAALVWNGGRPDEVLWLGDLVRLSRREEEAPVDGPCLIYFGESLAVLRADEGKIPRAAQDRDPPATTRSASPIPLTFPVWLKLGGERVLIVGGGTVALQKIRSLLGTGAQIDVVALAVRPELDRLLAEASLRRIDRRSVVESDLTGARLVVCAANDPATNAQVAEWARRAGIWVNSVDDPAACSLLTGAVVERGPVRVAIGTEGRLPGLSGLLRRLLEGLLPGDHDGAWADLEKARDELKSRLPSSPERMAILRETLGQLEERYFKKSALPERAHPQEIP